MFLSSIIFTTLLYVINSTQQNNHLQLPTNFVGRRNLQQISRTVDAECEQAAWRVVGGDTAGDVGKRWPYMVSLQVWQNELGVYSHHCGGVLINNKMILTSAHCLWLRNVQGLDYREGGKAEGLIQHQDKELTATVAPQCRHQEGVGRYRVKSYYMHPEYNGSPMSPGNFDIALLILEEGLTTANNIYADFESSQDVDEDTIGLLTVMGYGSTSVGDQRDDEFTRNVKPLQVGILSLYPQDKCERDVRLQDARFEILRSQVVCAFNENVDACIGDSGSPLLLADGAEDLNVEGGDPAKDVIYGLVSWGPDMSCSSIQGYPGVYTRVSRYIPWIQEKIALENLLVPVPLQTQQTLDPVFKITQAYEGLFEPSVFSGISNQKIDQTSYSVSNRISEAIESQLQKKEFDLQGNQCIVDYNKGLFYVGWILNVVSTVTAENCCAQCTDQCKAWVFCSNGEGCQYWKDEEWSWIDVEYGYCELKGEVIKDTYFDAQGFVSSVVYEEPEPTTASQQQNSKEIIIQPASTYKTTNSKLSIFIPQAGEELQQSSCPCGDQAPDGIFTCGEQRYYGKCGESWMQGYCQCTCGTC